MSSRWARTLRKLTVACVCMAAIGVSAPTPAAAAPVPGGDREVERRGHCRTGPGDWKLTVRKRSAKRLRITFTVDDIARHKKWQMFLSDNGRRVAAVTRGSGAQGEVRVRTATRNRKGRDRISGTAVNTRNGTTCTGHVRF